MVDNLYKEIELAADKLGERYAMACMHRMGWYATDESGREMYYTGDFNKAYTVPGPGWGPTGSVFRAPGGSTGDGTGLYPKSDYPEYYFDPYNDIYLPCQERMKAAFKGWSGLTDPTRFDSGIASLLEGMRFLAIDERIDGFQNNPDLTYIDTIGDYFTEYQGDYGRAFKANYLDKLDEVVSAQWYAARMIRHCLVAEQKVWETARADLRKLVANADTAMWKSGSGGVDWKVVLTVAGAIMDVAGLIPGPHEVVLDIVSKVQTGYGAIKDVSTVLGKLEDGEEKTSNPLSAGDPNGVMENIETALRDIDTKVTDKEREIRQRLEDLVDLMVGSKEGFDLSEPAIVDTTDPGQVFDDFDVNFETLQQIGKLWLPAIASSFYSAYSHITPEAKYIPFDRPSNVGLDRSLIEGSYNQAALLLANNLRDSSWETTRVASIILACRRYFMGKEDDISAELQALRTSFDQQEGAVRDRTW